MLTQNAGSQDGRPFMAVAETCFPAFLVSSVACTPGRKIIPGKKLIN